MHISGYYPGVFTTTPGLASQRSSKNFKMSSAAMRRWNIVNVQHCVGRGSQKEGSRPFFHSATKMDSSRLRVWSHWALDFTTQATASSFLPIHFSDVPFRGSTL